jgi:hypothetical protein
MMRGERARLLCVALQQAQKRSGQAISKAQVVGADDAVIIGVIGALGIAVIAAVVAGLGLFVLYDVLMKAMKRGYDLHDPKFRMAAGEGQVRQEHELAFILAQPGKTGAASPTPVPDTAPTPAAGRSGPGGFLAALPTACRNSRGCSDDGAAIPLCRLVPKHRCGLGVGRHEAVSKDSLHCVELAARQGCSGAAIREREEVAVQSQPRQSAVWRRGAGVSCAAVRSRSLLSLADPVLPVIRPE